MKHRVTDMFVKVLYPGLDGTHAMPNFGLNGGGRKKGTESVPVPNYTERCGSGSLAVMPRSAYYKNLSDSSTGRRVKIL